MFSLIYQFSYLACEGLCCYCFVIVFFFSQCFSLSLKPFATFVVELERVELLAAEHEEVDQVLSLTNTERATDVLLARESLIC